MIGDGPHSRIRQSGKRKISTYVALIFFFTFEIVLLHLFVCDGSFIYNFIYIYTTTNILCKEYFCARHHARHPSKHYTCRVAVVIACQWNHSL